MNNYDKLGEALEANSKGWYPNMAEGALPLARQLVEDLRAYEQDEDSARAIRLAGMREENEQLKEACAQFSKNETIFIREEAQRTRERDDLQARLSAAEEEWRHAFAESQRQQRRAIRAEARVAELEGYWSEHTMTKDLQARLSAAEAENERLTNMVNEDARNIIDLQSRLSACEQGREALGKSHTEKHLQLQRAEAVVEAAKRIDDGPFGHAALRYAVCQYEEGK